MSANAELLARTIDALADIGAILARQMSSDEAASVAVPAMPEKPKPARKKKAEPAPEPEAAPEPADEEPSEDLSERLTALMQGLAAGGKSAEMKELLAANGYKKRSEIPDDQIAKMIEKLEGLG